ncbi:heavy metal sensor histidine kinase [Caballeronia concitans]|uniref:Sensor protein n=1 Tax=Caballeronia concitans TaxID=1777133 RepID=A0A658R1I6_9BURK|nr:heavy metal sensor histidine kinase [Caballeronia concitans]KIG09860.1 multi-sensor signal transduction histidine kinase [Burkholderia sp. MR1]SAL39685.1 heavy metal sensor signal transduction histidine kinase [Caballeronia concitans]
MKRHSQSLAVRIALSFAAIVCVVVGMVGASLYHATNSALSTRADYQVIARVEHFRSLLHDLYTINEIEARPRLFETMLGDRQDVIIFRRAGTPPFINVNPEHMPLPPLHIVPVDRAIGLDDLYEGTRADGVRMRWVGAQARIGESGEVVEIIAAHVMTQEARVLSAYFARVWITVIGAVLVTMLLAWWVTRRGLMPLKLMADKAAEITPNRMSARLDVAHAPAELQSLAASFNAMLDRLEHGYERLLQFSADLAHELRTPIGVLIGETQVMLAHERSVAEYRGVLESNLEELERLARIAQNILFLAQADHSQQPIERERIDIREELETIAAYFEGIAEERRITFEIDASGEMRANAIMCRRAIGNVVVNAVRYAAAGTVVRLSGHVDANGARIVVGNRGACVAKEELARLFDRFYRGDAARSQFTESSGLGLSIVQAIMHMHGGTASADCTPDGWIEFTLRFPPDA